MSITNELLIELTNAGYSDSYIGKIANLTGSAIAHRRRKLGIVKDLAFQARCQFKSFNYYSIFESDLISPLIGTLLGDGWLTKSSEKSYTGGVSHSIKQFEYLEYKFEIFKPIVRKNKISSKITKHQILNGKDIFPAKIFSIRFKSSPDLYKLYSILYKNGKKVITDELLQYFNEHSLALFYFDDGYRVHRQGKTTEYRIVNYDLDYDSRIKFKQYLFNTMNIECIVHKNCFSFTKQNRDKLRIILEKYVVDCIRYKI